MITEIKSSLFDLEADALAHGCNIAGVMGAGIAKEFRLRYPIMYEEYKDYCLSDNFKLGDIHFYKSPYAGKPHVINIATQFSPVSGAYLEYVKFGLLKVEDSWKTWEIKSLAIPKIGCGLGLLEWKNVRKVVYDIFERSDLELKIAIID